jgi:hypothetical protein
MASNDLLTLTRGNITIDLYSWLHGSLGQGHEAIMGIEGFGLPPQTNRWFEGAGDGATYRGSRVLPRVMMIPISTQGPNRNQLDLLLSKLARVLAPQGSTQARLNYKDAQGQTWFLRVVREQGGDYVRAKGQFRKDKYLRTTLGLKAGDPFWTREEANEINIRQDDSGRGLLPYLAKLEVSSGQVFGSIIPPNSGDAPAWPVWTIGGPMTEFTLTSTQGEVLQWSGTMAGTDRRIIDAKAGTIVDQDGINRYNELGSAPSFWTIPSEESAAITIETVGAEAASFVSAKWQPRKWSLV